MARRKVSTTIYLESRQDTFLRDLSNETGVPAARYFRDALDVFIQDVTIRRLMTRHHTTRPAALLARTRRGGPIHNTQIPFPKHLKMALKLYAIDQGIDQREACDRAVDAFCELHLSFVQQYKVSPPYLHAKLAEDTFNVRLSNQAAAALEGIASEDNEDPRWVYYTCLRVFLEPEEARRWFDRSRPRYEEHPAATGKPPGEPPTGKHAEGLKDSDGVPVPRVGTARSSGPSQQARQAGE